MNTHATKTKRIQLYPRENQPIKEIKPWHPLTNQKYIKLTLSVFGQTTLLKNNKGMCTCGDKKLRKTTTKTTTQ